jgi:hypothetical protein
VICRSSIIIPPFRHSAIPAGAAVGAVTVIDDVVASAVHHDAAIVLDAAAFGRIAHDNDLAVIAVDVDRAVVGDPLVGLLRGWHSWGCHAGRIARQAAEARVRTAQRRTANVSSRLNRSQRS